MNGWKGTDPHFDSTIAQTDASLLRQIGTIGQELRQHLQPGNYVRGRVFNHGNLPQNPIDSEEHLQLLGSCGDQVQVARPGLSGGVEQKLDDLHGELVGLRIAPPQTFLQGPGSVPVSGECVDNHVLSESLLSRPTVTRS